LEIYADDVRCSHGASVGRLDEEAVYYMRQRGIPEAVARRMQIHGFAGEIVARCPSGALRDRIAARVGGLIDLF
jgi:Fe-S cluster assembly protein SufD